MNRDVRIRDGTMRIGLVGCVKSKRDWATEARDLYDSPLFQSRRSYVERTCGEWFILSALHGLVEANTVLEPYDKSLADVSAGERQQWSARVLRALTLRLGSLERYTFEVHMGAAYRDSGLVAGLVEAGARVENPTASLGLGQQLAFYRRALGVS